MMGYTRRARVPFTRIAARGTVVCFLIFGVASGAALAGVAPEAPRRVIGLDGIWQVEQGNMADVPDRFTHTVAVPGLLDMAAPPFTEVGKASASRRAFWYRRVFKVDGDVPKVARLMIHKACFGTRVFVNRHDLGEHLPCFTPAWFDVKPYLKGGGAENEVIVRVGADPGCLPADMPRGWDFEKYLYIPGIYDSVELILSGTPFIRNVQIVPEVDTRTARAVVELEPGPRPAADGAVNVKAAVRAVRTGGVAGAAAASTAPGSPTGGQTVKLELRCPIRDMHLWSPDDPFLYEMSLGTGGDAVRVRFGMRSFRFDGASGRALLNGKPYYMRGTNVCIFRFFEDEKRGDLPWRTDWARRLHEQFKTMHWNSIRYCIGFPPDFWYDVADEVGFLIQDEFPIWLLNQRTDKNPAVEFPIASKIIPEYEDWMRQRWNHPCVVIWDAQNESFTDETGKAIQAVRHLDLSNRPWENGWSEPQSDTDCVESHPYLFSRGWSGGKPFKLSEMPGVSGVPYLHDKQKARRVPIVINEYGWLWLNRDGTPTCLTNRVYESILGKNSTVEARRKVHARYVAALTEFWRSRRTCAGVLHFCGLGYSRAGDKPRPEGGATSDHWIDLEHLVFEPTFQKFVRDAFSPVGLMLDFWAEDVSPRSEQAVKVVVINDLEPAWHGEVRLRLLRGGECVSTQSAPCRVQGLGREIVTFKQEMPAEEGSYTLEAELAAGPGTPVRSLRDFKVAAKHAK